MKKIQKITKAVFPVAGLGTRFLPATKASPKEMLPVVDKPLIQYAVEEAAAAGITEMIFITGRGKRTIEDHFDKAYELEAELAGKGKHKLLQEVREMLPTGVQYVYVRQPEALGLGHAVLCAKHLVGDHPFAVILADDLIDAGDHAPVMRQMVEQYERHQASVLGVVNVERSLQVGARLGGHFVQGHVDALGSVAAIDQEGEWVHMTFRVPSSLTRQMVEKGSITVDGVSLTLVSVTPDQFRIALIPHTLQVTTLGRRAIGDAVNIETDILGKYIEKLLPRPGA